MEEEFEFPTINRKRKNEEGSSSNYRAVAEDNGEPFRVYCKGLVSKERVRDRIVEVAGIGVVICDSKDHVVFEMKKPLRNEQIMYVEIVELEALTEAMNAALTLNIKRLVFIFDDSKFHHPWRRSKVREEPSNLIRILLFIQGVQNLRDKFPHYSVSSVAEGDIKHAYRLARDAVISQISWPIETSRGTIWKETCAVCLEDVDVRKMFSVDYCLHRCCFSCVKKHVEVKLHHRIFPKCPFEGCGSELKIDSCRELLTQELVEIMCHRIKEAHIPVTERIYCPYSRCSTVMSKYEALEFSEKNCKNAKQSAARKKCIKCLGSFCVNCKVPWHENMSCYDYKRSRPYPCSEDAGCGTSLRNAAT